MDSTTTATATAAAAAATPASFLDSLPPDLFDQTTLVSLASVVVILSAAYGASKLALPKGSSATRRALFIWHAFDALIHFALEGSYLYHCFFSWISTTDLTPDVLASNDYYIQRPHPFLGQETRIYGPQAAAPEGALTPLADLWMVYARADKRWAGADLGVISLELLTVLVMGPLACLVCADLARGKRRANLVMLMVATSEIYGGWMTFCPEWLSANANLDTSNFMYLWVYLFFFNMLWVVIPFWVIKVAWTDISDAFSARDAQLNGKKTN